MVGEFTFTHERFFFTGCARGFSGVSGYNVGVSSSLIEVNKENLVFEETTAVTHTEGSVVTNLSVLFLQEFFNHNKIDWYMSAEEALKLGVIDEII